MTTPYYTYDETTKRLSRADDPATIDGRKVVHPSAAMYAKIGAYPLADPMPPAPTPPEGKVAVFDGYALDEQSSSWVRAYRFDPIPAPTVADFDAAMEEHLRAEREARGYTTREPDVYLNSEVPRWASDARDWVKHRDETMLYALKIMNAVERGEREPPTLDEFKAGLPQIAWTAAETAPAPGAAPAPETTETSGAAPAPETTETSETSETVPVVPVVPSVPSVP